MKITDVGAALDPQFERVDTPRTNDFAHNIGNDVDGHYVVDIDFARQLERELADAVAKERERCALVCERNIDAPAGTYQILMAAAKEIRKGE
jgi:hypothetical protein